jgi:hypothetical protein
MRALVQTGYGSADVMELREIEKPTPGDGDAPEAFRYLDEGHARGKVVIAV